jgi:hypothetical protein
VARIEGGLPTTHLTRRKLDLVAGGAEERLCVLGGLREDEVADAGREQLDARARRRY